MENQITITDNGLSMCITESKGGKLTALPIDLAGYWRYVDELAESGYRRLYRNQMEPKTIRGLIFTGWREVWNKQN